MGLTQLFIFNPVLDFLKLTFINHISDFIIPLELFIRVCVI